MKIFVSSGEASGDQLAGPLVAAMKRRVPGLDCWGMGSLQSKLQGMKVEWSSEALQLMGIGEVLSSIPRLLRLKREISRRIRQENPDAVVVVDSPDFHIPLLREITQAGYEGRIIYLAPPQVWAWRSQRAAFLGAVCDLCLPLFGFEHEFLQERNVRSAWVGHPFVDQIPFPKEGPPADRKDNRVALLPGSRTNEVWRLLPVLIEVGKALEKRGYEPVFSIAPGLRAEEKERLLCALSAFSVDKGPGRDLMRSSTAVIGASGTAAVEAMMLDRYMIVLYRISVSSEIIFRMFVRANHIAIPNILAEKRVYPELVQGKARADSILAHFDAYTEDRALRETVHERLKYARSRMGKPGAADFWAKSVLDGLGDQ